MSQHKRKTARRLRRTVTARDGVPTLSATAKSTLGALPLTVAIGLLFLFITTALLLCTKDPDRYHTAAGYAILYLTALAGGAIATRLNRRRSALLCGLGEGLLLLVFITVLGLILPNAWKNGTSAGIALLTRALLFPVSLGGALLAAKKPKKRRR